MANSARTAETSQSVCPWWLVHAFDNPLRRLLQPPEPIVTPFVRPGDTCLDVGCGMGYFTIPLAHAAGPSGRVTALDLQAKMLAGVARRAHRHGVADVIRLCTPDDPAWMVAASYDFILAFWMLHEVPGRLAFLVSLRSVLKPGGRLLLVEPRVHVTARRWQQSLAAAEEAGFSHQTGPRVSFSRSAVLEHRP